MGEYGHDTLADYRRKGFADRSGYGQNPGLLIVDFIVGFTDPSTPLGGDFSAELAATRRLLDAFRASALPVAFTTIAYAPDFRDAGVFVKKVPALKILVRGAKTTKVDARVAPIDSDYVLEKKFASAFFGTDLDDHLKGRGVDTVVIAGCTTSGCIRASAIDAMQYGFHTIVVRDAVGDRASGPHEANLFDIDAKYGDVVSLEEVLSYLRGITANGDAAARANDDFLRWWHTAAHEQRG